jgi:GTP-binding protein YchF
MTLSCGIVGLPNVGKSSLFNALTSSQNADSQNYPFCTIDPNSAIVEFKDDRLINLSNIANSQEITFSTLEFVDIAGLVKGASQGMGLGNQFLGHIRQVDAIVHVLRCFEDGNIVHVDGRVNPIEDKEIIETELIIADLDSAQKRIATMEKKLKNLDQESKDVLELLKKVEIILQQGIPARKILETESVEENVLKLMQLLTLKPVLYVCNVSESEMNSGNHFTKQIQEIAKKENAPCIIVCAKTEEDIAQLKDEEEKQLFLEELKITESGLDKIIKASYELLDLQSYFTVGPKISRSWTFKKGTNAQNAAGIIHTDFAKGFIRAEVISYEDYIKYEGEVKAKEFGKMRLEGKEYIVKDGDVMHFRFNV